MKLSTVTNHKPGRQCTKAVNITTDAIGKSGAHIFGDMQGLGMNISEHSLYEIMDFSSGMDAVEPMNSTPSIAVATQFLQSIMPGLVSRVTSPTKGDELLGVTTVGQWRDDQVVIRTIEHVGAPQRYSDSTPVPLANWNSDNEIRDIITFELGFQVGKLASERASAIMISDADEKRKATALALNKLRNKIALLGYNEGNRTYGFLNDPGLLPYNVVPLNAAATSTKWANKDFADLVNDLLAMLNALRVQSLDNVDPETSNITLAVASNARTYLNQMNALGTQSVMQWLKENVPKIRVISLPELDFANAGSSVAVMYAESIKDDMSTDGGATWIQAVQTQFMTVGVKQEVKYYMEDYLNAMAGAICKRPFLVTSWTGIA